METDVLVRLLFLLAAPPPPVPGTDAVQQEVEHLQSRFGGDIVHFGPSFRLQSYLPRSTYGWRDLYKIRKLEQRADLIHIYHSELYLFPISRCLRRPIVYTVLSGLQGQTKLPSTSRLEKLAAIAVPSHIDLDRLQQKGLENAHLVSPGIDLGRFDCGPPPPIGDFVLLAGSAPWTKKQFHTKGLETLLRVTQRIPKLRLVLLWRGRLAEEARRLIKFMGLEQRVEMVDYWVDVTQLYGRVHSAVVLADKPKLVRAFPHSLLEALACGRPVLVSDCIGMADYVADTGCGHVVRGLDEADLVQKIHWLEESYETVRNNALRVGKRDFSIEKLVASYGELYANLIQPNG
jgi:glycosyltransferase involved in cell wall biosynthesis